ncbi:MAG: hypothetical protein IT424_13760 [Pirellulales bacterium]|nr:hypothetical protein [Pirellulales bacterium]
MALLAQFLLRLAFGLAAAMAMVSPRQVASGYFRNHLYVVLGLASLAALLTRTVGAAAFPWAVAAAVLSYVGSVAWLYERKRLGVALLAVIAVSAAVGALALSTPDPPLTAAGVSAIQTSSAALRYVQTLASGLLLGVTTAAMLLGHWYLNAPGMQLAPLRRLLVLMAAAVGLQAICCGLGLGLQTAGHGLATHSAVFLMLRWSFGLIGVLLLAAMAWKTLDIPNTQSATGILYVAVIGAFVGETMSLLLSAEAAFPV